jgi:predicted Zn finger-like uncharacterized protein
MDVQCERCKTEYEFDDALVSGRGTTVKCTNCGLQFKVRPSLEARETERWVVRTAQGQELVFTSLRELQRAITTHEVGRGDTLSRGNAPPRTLGTIAELEPFFLARPPRPSDRPAPVEGNRSRMPTLRPPPAMAVPPSTAPARLAPVSGQVDRTAAAYSEAGTMMAPAIQHAPAPSVVSRREPAREPERATPRGRLDTADYPTVAEPAYTPPTVPVRQGRNSSGDYGDGIDRMDSLSDADSHYAPMPPRRRLGGWIVGAVLLAGVGVIAYKVAAPYLTAAPAAHKALDPRAQQFLTDGEAAFREGNLELTKEKFDKASALDETDPRVLLDVARLAAARADIPWLKTRILPEGAEDELRAAKQELSDLGGAAKRAADAAGLAAPDDVAATRVRVDALRIVGERDAARSSVTKIIANASQPETSYVLAALDLAEIDPLWSTVIDRLRVAAAGEGNEGRARAALVYALIRSGDATGAKAELERLGALPTAYPLLATLRAFVAFVAKGPLAKGPIAAASGSAHPAGTPSGAPTAVDVESLPRHAASGGGGGGGGGGSEEPSGGGGGGDPRELLRQAAAAENKGQFPRATKLYEDAMHADPANSEALAGLGSVSLKTGDYASARSYFGHALGLNPNYVPALVGQADAMWAEGDHAGATARYKEIVDRFPESSGFPSYVKTRAEGSASGAAAPAHAEPAAPPAAAPEKTPLPPGSTIPLPANVPSDLPGTPP